MEPLIFEIETALAKHDYVFISPERLEVYGSNVAHVLETLADELELRGISLIRMVPQHFRAGEVVPALRQEFYGACHRPAPSDPPYPIGEDRTLITRDGDLASIKALRIYELS